MVTLKRKTIFLFPIAVFSLTWNILLIAEIVFADRNVGKIVTLANSTMEGIGGNNCGLRPI